MAEVRELGAHHPLLKEIRRAASKGTLTDDGYAIAESFHLLDEARRSRAGIRLVIATRQAADRAAALHPDVAVVADPVFAQLSTTEHSQGVLALVRLHSAADLADLFAPPSLTVILDGLQDPGNAGAILRAAEAFGANGVVTLPGTVHLANPKALRASAGSCFRVPTISATVAALTPHLRRVYAAVAHDGMPIDQVDWTRDCSLVIGSEAHGVGEALRPIAQPIRIPTTGVESLNAAVAAGIILYEARRQRGSAR